MPCRLKSGAPTWNPVSNVGQGLGSVLELTLILCLIYIVDLVVRAFHFLCIENSVYHLSLETLKVCLPKLVYMAE